MRPNCGLYLGRELHFSFVHDPSGGEGAGGEGRGGANGPEDGNYGNEVFIPLHLNSSGF